jgi:heme/copper-type cytochrome/quinol oxidase subunit 2
MRRVLLIVATSRNGPRRIDEGRRMTRWTFLDWVFTVGPFIILAGVAWSAVRRSRRAVGR